MHLAESTYQRPGDPHWSDHFSEQELRDMDDSAREALAERHGRECDSDGNSLP